MSDDRKEWNQLVNVSPEKQEIRDLIDLTSRYNGYGELSRAYTNTLMGFDHRFAGIPVPVNTDSRGMIFFTRPRMNLSYDNIMRDRTLMFMAGEDKNSLGRAIRSWLDPIASRGTYAAAGYNEDNGRPKVESNLVDDRSPFIPVLSNALLSMGGWPDIVAEYFSSDQGIRKEQFFYYDGPRRYYGEYDLTCSWRNLPGDPITSLLQAWIMYGMNVLSGNMLPYPNAIVEREIDYNTRIYHFILDPSRRFIQKAAACGAAAPISAGIAAAFNFSSDQPYAQDNMRQISAPFHCVGVDYNDPIIFDEFNRLQAHYNPDMATINSRETYLVKVPYNELNLFNNYGYPYIDPLSLELQWWVYKPHYDRVKESMQELTDYNHNPNLRVFHDGQL